MARRRITKEAEVRRQELVDAAQRLFLERGYENTAVSDVVREVGVAQGTFYVYFGSKDEVMNAVAEAFVAPLIQRMRVVAESGGPPIRRVGDMVSLLFKLMHEHHRTIECLLKPSNDALHARVGEKLSAGIVPILTGIVEEGIRAGRFRLAQPRETVGLLLAMLTHLTREHTAGLDESRRRCLERATKVLFSRALGAKRDANRSH